MNNRRQIVRGMLACAAALLPGIADAQVGRSSRASRPDIVLFIADDMTRADVGAYGGPDARTPSIDQMAKEGLRFTNAFAASPTCTPSRSAMFTGDYPMKNGAHANHSVIKSGLKTLPAYLQAQGYRVVIAGKTHIGNRVDFPFEYFPASVVPPPRGQGVLRSQLNVQAIDKLLATRDRNKPLALIVAAFAPHAPWLRNDGYDPAKLAVPGNLLDTPELRDARARYLTRVTQADSELGAVRASVAKHGGGNTLFLFTADQGAQFPFAKWTLYDGGIATPLIAVWPGKVAAGRTNGAMVSLVDLLPTMQAAGGGTPATGIDGRSFLPVLLGQADQFHGEIYAAHSGSMKTGPNANIAPMRAIRTPDYKLILNYRTDIRYVNAISTGARREGSYWGSFVARAQTDPKARALVEKFHHRVPVEFYDLKADPLEQRNLADDPTQRTRIAEMRRKLETWMVGQGEDPANVALPSTAHSGEIYYAQNQREKGNVE